MRRVVITGLGAIGPNGHTAPSTWEGMRDGVSGITPLDLPEPERLVVRIGGQVKGFDAREAVGRKEAKRMDRFMHFAVVASEEAWRDAGLEGSDFDPVRLGCYIGTAVGGLGEIIDGGRRYAEMGIRGLGPFYIPRALTNLGTGHVSMRLNLQGPSLCVSTACATGNHSIGEALRAIQYGDADIILAGGAEASLLPLCLEGFAVMKALSRRNDDPQAASRPFDADRDGFVMGEGAGILVLEELEHAKARGARIYAELSSYAMTSDAHHLTAPAPRGAGAARCMQLALDRAGLNPQDVDYINAHGTSTPINDRSESQAIGDVFGDHAARLMISSTKSVTGHLLGAAGGVEAVATAMALYTQTVPPTANWETRDPECPWDYVPKTARETPVRAAISNSFGFGGTNATLAFRRFEG